MNAPKEIESVEKGKKVNERWVEELSKDAPSKPFGSARQWQSEDDRMHACARPSEWQTRMLYKLMVVSHNPVR